MVSPRLFLVIGVFTLLVIVGGYASAQMSSNDLDPATYKDHNDLLKEIASRVPEFGGAYSSNNGTTLNIYLTENETSQEKQQNTQEALEDLLDVKPGLTLNVIKGTYTITQLSEWYETLRTDGIWNRNGVITTDLNEGTNKLYVGVTAAEDIAGVQTFLDEAGIPREAVTIEVESLETPKNHTVRQRPTTTKWPEATKSKGTAIHYAPSGS